MSSEHRAWSFRIRHILEAIAESRAFVAGMSFAEFCDDLRTLKAVVWNLAMIGEAARHVPETVQKASPDVPWQDMRGMRNHIVHGYDRIDPEIVWQVVQVELPPLVPHLERILQKHGDRG
jgi:uncharacterized protein with HEPN domain